MGGPGGPQGGGGGAPTMSPMEREKVFQWIAELVNPETRENSLLELRYIVFFYFYLFIFVQSYSRDLTLSVCVCRLDCW